MDVGDGVEEQVGVEGSTLTNVLQFTREDVDEEFSVGRGIEVATVGFGELSGELASVGEVSVVNQDDAVGGVHVKRLGFFFAFCLTPSRVTDVTETGVANESAHIAGAKGLTHLPFGFVDVEA